MIQRGDHVRMTRRMRLEPWRRGDSPLDVQAGHVGTVLATSYYQGQPVPMKHADVALGIDVRYRFLVPLDGFQKMER